MLIIRGAAALVPIALGELLYCIQYSSLGASWEMDKIRRLFLDRTNKNVYQLQQKSGIISKLIN